MEYAFRPGLKVVDESSLAEGNLASCLVSGGSSRSLSSLKWACEDRYLLLSQNVFELIFTKNIVQRNLNRKVVDKGKGDGKKFGTVL